MSRETIENNMRVKQSLMQAMASRNTQAVRDIVGSHFTDGRQGLTNQDLSEALIHSARSQYADVVPILSKNREIVNGRDQNGMTPLHFAAISGNPRIIDSLISTGADVNLTDREGAGAFAYASMSNNPEAVRKFLPPESLIPSKILDLRILSQRGLSDDKIKDCVRCIRSAGVNINARDASGKTAIMIAAERDSFATFNGLIENGADIHARDNTGKTVQEYAAGTRPNKMLDKFREVYSRAGTSAAASAESTAAALRSSLSSPSAEASAAAAAAPAPSAAAAVDTSRSR